MKAAPGCRCRDPLVFVDEPEHCFRCGRGPCSVVLYGRRPNRRRPLPHDLGSLAREGRRPDLNLDNVVRLDRLRTTARRPIVLSGQTPVDRAVELGLTRREAEVLEHVATGLTNPQIAEKLVVAEQTVKFHLGRLFVKVGASNRVEAARWWWERVERPSSGLAA